MTVLVCAATRTELAACERGVAAAHLDARFTFLLTGVGAAHAEQALGDHLERGTRPALVVSSGFAGALAPGLEVGAWITAAHLAGAKLRPAPAPATSCTLKNADELVIDARSDADAVDMESAALARVANVHGVDLMVLRLVSDSRARPLPKFLAPFTAAMTAVSTREKVAHAMRGLGGALVDPRGAARLVRDGSALARELAAGWQRFAPALA